VKNKIEDLRNHLFMTLEALRDEEKPMDLERAKAVADVAHQVILSAKVEVEYMKVTGATQGTGFIAEPPEKPAIEGNGMPQPRLVRPMGK
jgi:hypothetical protein